MLRPYVELSFELIPFLIVKLHDAIPTRIVVLQVLSRATKTVYSVLCAVHRS